MAHTVTTDHAITAGIIARTSSVTIITGRAITADNIAPAGIMVAGTTAADTKAADTKADTAANGQRGGFAPLFPL
jgi:hypothetical protein